MLPSESATAAYERGVAHLKRAEYDAAVSAFTEAIRLNPEARNAYTGRALARRSLDDESGALADEQMARELADPPDRTPTIAQPTAMNRQSALQRFFEDPLYILLAPFVFLFALLFHWYLREWFPGERRAEEEQRKVRGLLDRAGAQLENGVWEPAAATLTEVIGMLTSTSSSIYFNPALIEAYHRRATAYLALGQLDHAITDCTRVIMADPTPITRAEPVPPYVAEAYVHRGAAFARLGQHNEAIDDFTEAIQLSPGLRTPYALRAQSRSATGDTEGAADDEAKARSVAK
jgi:tetratricopeptide (TPR) repeat protein